MTAREYRDEIEKICEMIDPIDKVRDGRIGSLLNKVLDDTRKLLEHYAETLDSMPIKM